MNNRDVKKLENYFKDKPVNRAFLFGSHVSGDISNESDIDILVELDYSEPIGLRFLRMKHELEDLLDRKVDLVTGNSVSKYIISYIDQEKQLIYEKRN